MSFLLKLLSSVKTSYLPAVALFLIVMTSIFGVHVSFGTVSVCFYAQIVSLLCLGFFAKNNKDVLFSTFLVILYVSAGYVLQLSHGLQKEMLYAFLVLLVPIYISLFFFVRPEQITFSKVILFLIPAAAVENFYIAGYTQIPPFFMWLSILFWCFCFVLCLWEISRVPSFKASGMFFACVCVFLALVFENEKTYFTLYFAGSAGIFLVGCLCQMFFSYYYDPTTGVSSVHSFERDEIKKFPPKYSIAFFYVDNYPKLLKVFGSYQAELFVKMIILKVRSQSADSCIYRLSRSEFCLLFFDMDVRETYEVMENIRRLVASTEYVGQNKKNIKLTITPVVSEKRRSDTDAKAVLLRMHEHFHQKYKFTQNMTFCEEIEQSRKQKKYYL